MFDFKAESKSLRTLHSWKRTSLNVFKTTNLFLAVCFNIYLAACLFILSKLNLLNEKLFNLNNILTSFYQDNDQNNVVSNCEQILENCD